MSPQDCVSVTFSFSGMRWASKTHSARNSPARHCATASIGLFTLEFDVAADELRGHVAAALIGYVGRS